MRILFLTQFSVLGGSSRIQVIQFLPILGKKGIFCTHRHMYPDSFFKIQMRITPVGWVRQKINLIIFLAIALVKKLYYALTAFRYDIVVIQKETFPKSLFALMTLINNRIVYEIDDTIFEVNPFLNRSLVEGAMLRYQARLCINMMKKAAIVIAENEYLAAEARKHNKQVSILSAPIDVEKYYPNDGEKEDLVLGWIGSPSTTYMLQEITPALQEISKRYGNIRLVTVGAASTFNPTGLRLEKRAWKLEEELADLQSFDIGLMPLDDSPFQRGRLGYKMIQYMCVGIPIVASSVGLNPTVVKDGVNGFLALSISEWVEALSKLIDSPELRRRLGRTGREMVVERFSLETKSEIYLDAFNQLLS